jgi:hypothetical protein
MTVEHQRILAGKCWTQTETQTEVKLRTKKFHYTCYKVDFSENQLGVENARADYETEFKRTLGILLNAATSFRSALFRNVVFVKLCSLPLSGGLYNKAITVIIYASIIEKRLEFRCLNQCFFIWNYFVGCLWAPLLVSKQSKETVFLIKLSVFYNKNKILTIFFIVKYEKITL